MLDGFDPRLEDAFFERQRGRALLVTTVCFAGLFAWGITRPPAEKSVPVELEPQLRDFAVDEPEPEPETLEPVPAEPAAAPPPAEPPPRDVAPPQRKTPPKAPPKITSEPTKAAPKESAQNKPAAQAEGSGGAGHGKGGGGTGKAPAKPAPEPTPAPKAAPKPAPSVDPTKPIDRPEQATLPKPNPANVQPEYPKALRDEGITGKVVIKLHIHRDGSVRGAKILLKDNSATTTEEKDRANKLFLAAVLKVVQTWKYEPAKLEGTPISIWYPVTFPFSLTAG